MLLARESIISLGDIVAPVQNRSLCITVFAIALTNHQIQPRFAAWAAVEAPGASICARLDAQQGQLPSVVLRLTGGRQD